MRGLRRAVSSVDELYQILIRLRGSVLAIRPEDIPRGVRPSDIFQRNLSQQTPDAQMRLLRGGHVDPATGLVVGGDVPNIPTTTSEGRPGPPWGEFWTPEETLRTRPGGAADLGSSNAFADRLQALADQIKDAFGEGSYFAAVMEMEIPFLRIGARSEAEANLFIQSFAPFFLPGLQRALMDPTISNAARNIIQEAINTVLTGTGGPSAGALDIVGEELDVIGEPLTPGGSLAPGPRGAPPTTAARGGRSTAAGIGGALGRVSEQVAALGVTVERTAREQTRQVVGAVGTPQEVASAVRTGLQPDLRNLRSDLRTDAELGRVAFGRELAQELERYSLSGVLTGTGTR